MVGEADVDEVDALEVSFTFVFFLASADFAAAFLGVLLQLVSLSVSLFSLDVSCGLHST